MSMKRNNKQPTKPKKPAPRKKATREKTVRAKKPTKIGTLDIEKVLEYIAEGMTYRGMAKKLKVSLGTLGDFVAKSEHSARVREALQISAEAYADKAEEFLLKAKKGLEIARARELAQHYRWKASKRAPKKYGDKMLVTDDPDKLEHVQIFIPDNNRK